VGERRRTEENPLSTTRRLAAIGLGCIALMAPVTASAATSHSITPASVCGWSPTNNMAYGTGWNGNSIPIRTGPSSTCGVRGSGYRGDSTYLHCTDGPWVYVTDYRFDTTGWVPSGAVHLPALVLVCN
jgi:hypothetical protein